MEWFTQVAFETLLKFVINTSLHGFLKLHFSTLFKKIEKAFKCFRMLLTWQSYASVILRCSRPTHSSKPFVQSVCIVYIEGLERLRRRLASVCCLHVSLCNPYVSRMYSLSKSEVKLFQGVTNIDEMANAFPTRDHLYAWTQAITDFSW